MLFPLIQLIPTYASIPKHSVVGFRVSTIPITTVMSVVFDCHSSMDSSKMCRFVLLKNLHSDLETVDSSHILDNSIKLEV